MSNTVRHRSTTTTTTTTTIEPPSLLNGSPVPLAVVAVTVDLDAIHHEYEFGGPVGVTAMMVFFPTLFYYLYTCLFFYDGQSVRSSPAGGLRRAKAERKKLRHHASSRACGTALWRASGREWTGS